MEIRNEATGSLLLKPQSEEPWRALQVPGGRPESGRWGSRAALPCSASEDGIHGKARRLPWALCVLKPHTGVRGAVSGRAWWAMPGHLQASASLGLIFQKGRILSASSLAYLTRRQWPAGLLVWAEGQR